jgi:glycosyltransferase involved in cell wall biosynthesis
VRGLQRENGGGTSTGLHLVLDRPLPETLPVGPATAVFCVGTCFHRHRAVTDLQISVDGVRHQPAAQRMPRPDRFRDLHPTLSPEQASSVARDSASAQDPELRSYRSGFWGTVPIAARQRQGRVELIAEARLDDGATASAPLGAITVVDADQPRPLEFAPRPAGGQLIAICMATFNPNVELFRAQIESIRAQTDRDWVCVISDDCSDADSFEQITAIVGDDERFALSRSDRHLSFYRNFERALRLAPPEAELIALSDHDDRWRPDKLEALRHAIGSAGLAYSDLTRVDQDGRVRSETLWRGRRNNRSNLASLLISNSIPGAACMIRRRVIERALPFPAGPGWDFHDHWLALVALAMGDLAYVDRPLYDYVQHPGAVLGRVTSNQPPAGDASRGGILSRWRAAYFSLYLQREFLARILLARCAAELSSRKRRALRLVAGAARSPLAFAWLAVRPIRALAGRNETLRVEEVMVKGVLWRHAIALRSRRRERPTRADDDASVPAFDPPSLGPRQRRWLARQ